MYNIQHSTFVRKFGKDLVIYLVSLLDDIVNLDKSESFILVYHRVINSEDRCGALSRNNFVIYQDEFVKQIHYLQNNYIIVSVDTLINDLRHGVSTKGKIAITFDDGFKDTYENVFPVIKKFNVPVTIYLMGDLGNTGAISYWWLFIKDLIYDTNENILHFSCYEFTVNTPIATTRNKNNAIKMLSSIFMSISTTKHPNLLKTISSSLGFDLLPDHSTLLLTKEMIIEMHNSKLVDFGGHSRSHAVLSQLNAEELYADIFEQKKHLENVLGITLKSFAYPYGMKRFVSKQSIAVIKDSGYKYALSGEIGILPVVDNNYFMLPRVTTTGTNSVRDLKACLTVLYSAIRSRFGSL